MSLLEEDITSIALTERRSSLVRRPNQERGFPLQRNESETNSTIRRNSKDRVVEFEESTLIESGTYDLTNQQQRTEVLELTPNQTPTISRANSDANLVASSTGVEFSLPPVDGGFNAWMVLLGGFVIEGFVWGYTSSFSVYLQHYQKQPEFAGASVTELTIIGTLATGISYIGGFLVGLLGGRFTLKTMMYAGSVTMVIALVAASFATQVWHLILTQGFLFGLGGAFVYNSLCMFIPIYFFKYRGIASGFIYAGAGVFGLACPTLIDMSLKSIDWRWTLRIVALFVLVFCLGSSFVIRPRHSTDDARSYASLSRKDFAFIKNKRFLIMAGAVLFQGLGFFVPNLFIQPYAQWLGSSEQVSTIMLSILNAATIIGQLALGHVCDRYGYATSAVISSGIASLSVFLLWGFAGQSFGLLIAFAVIYGTFGSGFTSSFPSIVTDIAGTEYRKPILINGVFMLLRGIGNVVGNPIGSVILTSTSGAAGWADMSYFVGSTLIASAVCGAVIRFMPSRIA
ncbi:hypothetical protein K450DRAFT_238980 [Umbelopsis ramanniana AG]|uniref:Major facilitator superfamily (MFS) profile domain-containing protein n=1 Tax=Umbelopsis ramanniana AG TaxID=1314678 RepID=A0AAD5HEV5_UMBRA|nr:uncharacterized protein K450DRAFT_238980 [Umbelopsis ramanniana AG]KAI8580021.1 hypothetical protein K450DRAFT_238980 [Umbelopsis ramanniana AG]